MRIGVTGSQYGATEAQLIAVTPVLQAHITISRSMREVIWLHHGDCIGVDAQLHVIARALGYQIVSHPPIDEKKRAFMIADEVRKSKVYRERNLDIASEVDVLIALPGLKSSGTWMTVRFARGLLPADKIIVIMPDGSLA